MNPIITRLDPVKPSKIYMIVAYSTAMTVIEPTLGSQKTTYLSEIGLKMKCVTYFTSSMHSIFGLIKINATSLVARQKIFF